MEDQSVNEWMADPNTVSCEVYGHQFEDDTDRPGVRVCVAVDCTDEYVDV